MSTFITTTGSVTLAAYEDSWSEVANAEVDVRGFPGGDAVAVSLAGQREIARTVTFLFSTVPAYRTFAAMRGRLGTLKIDNWDTLAVSAVLKKCTPSLPHPDGTLLVRAEFVLIR